MEWTNILFLGGDCIVGAIIGVFIGRFIINLREKKRIRQREYYQRLSDLEERVLLLEEHEEENNDLLDIIEQQTALVNDLMNKIEELSSNEDYEFKFAKPVMQIDEKKVRGKPGPKPKIQE